MIDCIKLFPHLAEEVRSSSYLREIDFFRRCLQILGKRVVMNDDPETPEFVVQDRYHATPFATHQPWLFFSDPQLWDLLTYCPETRWLLPTCNH